MKAVILAAGKGTRLGELTKIIPKPMIPVNGKPVIEYVICGIQKAGIDEFVLVTKYLSEKIEDYFGDGSRFGIRIQYARQGEKYGTGAALASAREFVGDEPIIMTFADVIMSSVNYREAKDTFLLAIRMTEGSGDRVGAVITLNEVLDPCTGADVKIDNRGRVKQIIEKPPPGTSPTYMNSSGLFVFDPVIFRYLERLEPSYRGEYELPDAMNQMIEDGFIIYPYYLQGFWKDVGRVEDIDAAAELLRIEE